MMLQKQILMPSALDASIVPAWVFPDEQHPVADAALERLDPA